MLIFKNFLASFYFFLTNIWREVESNKIEASNGKQKSNIQNLYLSFNIYHSDDHRFSSYGLIYGLCLSPDYERDF